ncbi:hypothetical protein J8J42_05060 [Chryseobacterium sp. cx-311]|uniref:hypothetical protein n=1 Tax=Marnyiella aurantia TaxID=2758037 RepID=UPI001AEA5288|nr:hypothetical protein [Marnyiella aurantia]MBP0612412.1 hypothetical protein [Marnyiella aurantia]
MKKQALRAGTRVKLISQAMGYKEGSVFIISSFANDMQSSYEYHCYLQSDNKITCTFFDDEFEVIY